MPSKIILPNTPTVTTEKETVVIHFSNDSTLLWGVEETIEEASRIAQELELELKAVKYVQWHVHYFVKDMKKQFESFGINEELLDSILIDGHTFARNELNKESVDPVIMGAERGLRKKVLEQIYSNNYIV